MVRAFGRTAKCGREQLQQNPTDGRVQAVIPLRRVEQLM
jgi:hypothetical protein